MEVAHDGTPAACSLLVPPSAGVAGVGHGGDAGGGDLRDHAADLYLDQIVSAITTGREDHETLERWFFARTRDVATVQHRHDVFRDLEDPDVWSAIKTFSASTGEVSSHLSQAGAMRVLEQRQAWTLDAAAIYCSAVRTLAEQLGEAQLGSRGMQDVRRYLAAYAASQAFGQLEAATKECRAALGSVSYCVHIDGPRVTVRRYEGEADYSEEIQSVFERFRQGAVRSYLISYRMWPGMTRVGEQVLGLLVRLFPQEFARLGAHFERHAGFFDPGVRRFFSELQFYVSYRAFIDPLRAAGLSFCYPEVDGQPMGPREPKEELAEATFDLSLAALLVGQGGTSEGSTSEGGTSAGTTSAGTTSEGSTVVTNDFRLEAGERIFVVSGPNQGGKTTFARTFGQLHHLAAIGVPVPGRRARIFLCDRIFTHFEREEDLSRRTGKLESDLLEMQRTLRSASSESVVIMNEVFSSTSLEDARLLGGEVMRRLLDLGCLGVYVTFVDELASLAPSVVSLISTVLPEDPATRTFKVVRGPADGLAYALALAEKHRVTYRQLLERIS